MFDEINHNWILDNIPMDKRILKEFLKAGYIENYHLFPTEKGTSQGGPISPIIGNMALNGLENVLAMRFYSRSNRTVDKSHQNKHKVNYVRFADDLVATADSPETAYEIIDLIQAFLDPRGLNLSKEKTLITNINEGFNFLGWNFRKYKGKLLIKPSLKSIKSITQKLKTIACKAKSWTQDKLIKTLNPVITGWANYHLHIVAKDTFRKLDSYLWEITWRWGKRRHPNKGHKWVANKYWSTEGARNWVFQTKKAKLLKFSDAKIRRHSLPKLDANPYLNMNYFLERKDQIKKQTPWIQTRLPFFA